MGQPTNLALAYEGIVAKPLNLREVSAVARQSADEERAG